MTTTYEFKITDATPKLMELATTGLEQAFAKSKKRGNILPLIAWYDSSSKTFFDVYDKYGNEQKRKLNATHTKMYLALRKRLALAMEKVITKNGYLTMEEHDQSGIMTGDTDTIKPTTKREEQVLQIAKSAIANGKGLELTLVAFLPAYLTRHLISAPLYDMIKSYKESLKPTTKNTPTKPKRQKTRV
ncbi:MAG: hypothetical protein LBU87_03510 [Lactobacillales bacterium]|nr:hypothetical protein [Lactobacillales bacterium]